jgi:hypothetical protein
MTRQIFKSKVDGWIVILFALLVLIDIAIIVNVAALSVDPLVTTITVLLCVGAILLLLALGMRTYYAVDKGTLRIVSGPFSWNIAIEEISSVTSTRSLLSGPALSLDRLLVRYGKRGRILVSPANKQGFLRALGQTEN